MSPESNPEVRPHVEGKFMCYMRGTSGVPILSVCAFVQYVEYRADAQDYLLRILFFQGRITDTFSSILGTDENHSTIALPFVYNYSEELMVTKCTKTNRLHFSMV